ncbi:(2Fe-2S)-binding protein [Nocardia uniformis]|uniref:(2Fe-2S)-binding protein n=1 Tax=Nocardia uniformis TaxID=53432 RepID=UPI000A8FF3E1|nr:(2Fe-2S)-binding protein [Nocardia uniformis]
MNAAIVPGTELLNPRWLTERIADMGISWGTADSRVSGTLWWCMAASSLVTPIVSAYAAGRPAMNPALDHIACEIRPDGGIERVLPLPAASELGTHGDEPCHCATAATGQDAPDETEPTALASGCTGSSAGPALRHTLSQVIPVVAEVSGAGPAALWAIVADAIGNRALDIGAQESGAQLARDIAGRLPIPRFIDIAPRTFVRRISCCLVFEVPGCDMCTSCPKRPAPQREALLAELAARG